MNQVLIVDALRTPRGRGNDKGSLKQANPAQLLAQSLQALVARHNLDTSWVVDSVFGCVTQTGAQGTNIGKLALLQAGWSDKTSGTTLNRYCASGLSAVQFAAYQAIANDALAIGGGIEMMSSVPMGSDRGALMYDAAFQRQHELIAIGVAADAIATLEEFSREACDAYALTSQQRAAHARDSGWFKSVVPVLNTNGSVLLERDETPRPQTSAASLAGLQPAFEGLASQPDTQAILRDLLGSVQLRHVHHAGNSPAPADGASTVLLASATAADRHGLRPRARILSFADAAAHHTIALTGAVDATQRALEKSGLTTDDIDLFEVNESFASPMLHYMRHMKINSDRLNVNGGAIALGHAMGSTGSALIGIALDELERRDAKRAVVAICGATGVAVATVIERV